MATNTARQPKASAITGTITGVRIAPAVAEAFMMPSTSERSPARNQIAMVLIEAGVPSASVAPSATRTIVKAVRLRTSPWSIAARLQLPTASALPRRQPERSISQPAPSRLMAAANWKTEVSQP